MKSQPHRFSNDRLLEILSLSQNATAIYTGEEFTIQTANDMMIGIFGKDRSIIGKPLTEAVPEIIGKPFLDLLVEVWRTGITYEAKDAEAEIVVNGKLQTFYFDFIYRAIKNDAGEVDCILHTATDVTELNLGRNLIYTINRELQDANEKLAAANEELAASNEELLTSNEEISESRLSVENSLKSLRESENRTRSIIEATPFPIGVFAGREMRIIFANHSIMDVWGKGHDVVGKLYSDILPELVDQEIFQQVDDVFTTGIPFGARNQQINLMIAGEVKVFYFNYNFTALRNEAGDIYGVMNTAADVTDIVLSKQKLESSAEEMAAINEELTASNEEMVAFNLELKTLYEQLRISQDETQLAINAAGLATFDLNPMTGKFTGNGLLKLWFGLQEDDEIELQRAIDVIAEADREKVSNAIGEALDPASGGNYEAYYTIINPLTDETRIVRAKGKVLFNEHQQAVRLRGVLLDMTEQFTSQRKMEELINSLSESVTEQVNARKEIVDINTRLNIAIDAGGLGSTEVDLATGTMICNGRFKQAFGRTPDQEFTYPDLFEAMLPQYRDPIKKLVAIAIKNQTIYEGEYEVKWPDGSIHWINAHGKARYDSEGKAIKMVGLISDVTESKADEQRKNDFIGMVSHELKTPLTSLSGYVQMLHKKAQKSGDAFTAGALDMANKQVKKMTTMINGFLNVTRLESGKIHIDEQMFDMAGLINEVREESNLTISSHKVIFSEVEEIMINADRDKIGQVINNFISNALKYAPLGSTIDVKCERIDNWVQVSVKDEGLGIKEEDQQKLFERYYRVKDQPSTISGFGIGLYLCAEVIHRHEGKIWVESEPDKGSTFYFRIPV